MSQEIERLNIQEADELSPESIVILRREMFKEGTLGYKIFPTILEGRERPAGVFLAKKEEANLHYIQEGDLHQRNLFLDSQVKFLSEAGINTIDELLNLDESEAD